jgi:hypothetical protein
MNPKQAAHLNRITDEAHARLIDKYYRGVKEHKTVLSEDYTPLQVLEMSIEEAIDQVTYLLTLKEMLNGTDTRH